MIYIIKNEDHRYNLIMIMVAVAVIIMIVELLSSNKDDYLYKRNY